MVTTITTNPLTKWDYRWLGEAKLRATYSKDPSTQVGAVIARDKEHLSFGYNGFPKTCEDLEEYLHDRETKYKLVVHAECNAIFNSTRSVRGYTVYTYPLAPCPVCSTLIAGSGLVRVVSLIDPMASGTPRYFDTKETEFILNANKIPFHWEYVEQ